MKKLLGILKLEWLEFSGIEILEGRLMGDYAHASSARKAVLIAFLLGLTLGSVTSYFLLS